MPGLCQGSATALRGGLRPALTQTSAASAYHSSIRGIRFSNNTISADLSEFIHR